MSCSTCGIVLDCPSNSGNPPDIAIMTGVYSTNPFIVTVDCPAGYYCVPGIFPVVINPGIPPAVTIDPDAGLLILQGCQSAIIRRVVPGSSPALIQATIQAMQQEWSRQQANCIALTGGGGAFPAPTRLPGPGQTGGRIDISNTQQCYTAACPGGSPTTTQCITAGTVAVTLFAPTPDQIAQIQAQVNATALQSAQANAQAALGPLCGICNSAVQASQTCAGDPSKITSVSIPAAKYCVAAGTANGQTIVDAKANNDLVNQLNANLVNLGCVCPGPTVNIVTGDIVNPCSCQYFWNLNSPLIINLAPNVPFNPVTQYIAFNGAQPPGWHLGYSHLCPINCPGPCINQYF